MRGAGIADELLTSSIQYIINVAMTLPAILYLDRFGRRPTLLIGSFLMALWLFISGALQATYGTRNSAPNAKADNLSWIIPREHKAVSKSIVACSYLFVATFATTWGPTSWTYPAEVSKAESNLNVKLVLILLADLSSKGSCQSSFTGYSLQLDLELHSRFCSATSPMEHQLEDVHG